MTEREKLADEIERWVRRYQELEIAFHEATHNRGDVQAALEEFKAHRMGVASIMVAYFPAILTALRADSDAAAGLQVDDFEMMLRRLVHRLRQRPDLPLETMLAQAEDLLCRKGRASILRAALEPPP